ncbi:uncharacterized protein HMPREF1120_00047 [Exophiala dermatitidis NIH/UT8656]|uniref:Uncharacterized protein n=1 Tax=Exophiala dermatitidis (strain ATCC 34100 / CBS 525.76 / NIH/UT8656) TaxID=858893 RepID=H6BL73_EXODN|nr:uncharacterized protein HMPREF1120_00047 [Exophiala dermatitidis NIH/UT8656]EHY51820.1 hypothetical protein HMPREF1120_00047 [Exophiala dermatitidis NIH/UT8656]
MERLRSKSSSSTRVDAPLFFRAGVLWFLEVARSNLSSSNASSRSLVRELMVCMASLRSRCSVRRDATICFSSAGIV